MCKQAESDGRVPLAAQGSQPALGSCLHGAVPVQLCLCPAQEAREDTEPWHAPAVTQWVRFISLRSLALFFFLFNPLASLTLFYNPSLGSLKSTSVIKHVGACE